MADTGIKFLPGRLDILLLEAHHGYASRAGDLQDRHLVLLGNIGDVAQIGRGDQAQGKMRDNGVTSIFLAHRALFSVFHGEVSFYIKKFTKYIRQPKMTLCLLPKPRPGFKLF